MITTIKYQQSWVSFLVLMAWFNLWRIINCKNLGISSKIYGKLLYIYIKYFTIKTVIFWWIFRPPVLIVPRIVRKKWWLKNISKNYRWDRVGWGAVTLFGTVKYTICFLYVKRHNSVWVIVDGELQISLYSDSHEANGS